MKINLKNLIFGIVALFSSMVVLRLGSLSLFKYLILIAIVICLLSFKKPKINNINKIYICGYIFMIISLINAVTSQWQDSWKSAAKYQFIWFSIFLIFYLFATNLKEKTIKTFFKWLYIGFFIQLIWATFQFIIYYIWGTDINSLFFYNIYQKMNSSIYIKNGLFGTTGLAWHPANLIPIVIVTYFNAKNFYLKSGIVLVGIATSNSTMLIGILFCVFFDIFNAVKSKKYSKIKTSFILSIIVVILITIIFSIQTNFISSISSRFEFLFNRVLLKLYDGGSTNAHMRYYTSIFDIIRSSSAFQILFGYGEGCSGYTMTKLFKQFENLGAWSVECDIINILWNRGIVGFICFYGWLIKILKNGKKINAKYVYSLLTIILCGIFYNIQFDWVIIFEIMLSIAIENSIDIFNLKKVEKNESKI